MKSPAQIKFLSIIVGLISVAWKVIPAIQLIVLILILNKL